MANNDKRELAKMLAEELVKAQVAQEKKKSKVTLGMNDKELAEYKERKALREREYRLLRKMKDGKDTVADNIELAKLRFGKTGWGKAANLAGSAANLTASAAIGLSKPILNTGGALMQGVAGSKMSKNLYTALMYSNPVTALLAENMDLFKGVGKAGLTGLKGLAGLGLGLGKAAGKGLGLAAEGSYSLWKNYKSKQKEKSTAAKILEGTVIPNSSTGTALIPFLGEENQGIENAKNITATAKVTDKENKKASKNMLKAVEDTEKHTKEANNFLKAIKGRTVLMAGALLLGVAAIVGLAAWLKGKFPDPVGAANNLVGNESKKISTKVNSLIGGSVDSFQTSAITPLIDKYNVSANRYDTQGFGTTALGKSFFDDKKLKNLKENKKITNFEFSGLRQSAYPSMTPSMSFYESAEDYKTISMPVPIVILKKYGPDPETGKQNWVIKSVITKKLLRIYDIVWDLLPQKESNVSPKNLVIPENTPFAIVSKRYKIVGDKAGFVGNNNIQLDNYLMESASDLSKNYSNVRTDEVIKAHGQESMDRLSKIAKETSTKNSYIKAANIVLKPFKKSINEINPVEGNIEELTQSSQLVDANKNMTNALQNVSKTNPNEQPKRSLEKEAPKILKVPQKTGASTNAPLSSEVHDESSIIMSSSILNSLSLE